MRDGYLSHFGLREPPFSKEVPDMELWLPSSKQGIVDELCDVVESRSSAVLVGDPGVGKTCVLRALRKRLPDAGFRLTYCHQRHPRPARLSTASSAWRWGSRHRRRRRLSSTPSPPTCTTSGGTAFIRSSSSTRPTYCTRTRSTTCTSSSTCAVRR